MVHLAFNAVILTVILRTHSAAGKRKETRLFYNEFGFMSLVDINS